MIQLTSVAQAEPRAGRRPREFSGAPRDTAMLMRTTAEARTALLEAAMAAAAAADRALSLAELLDEGLHVLAPENLPPIAPRPVREADLTTDSLSPREREVLALVAAGQTNKAIAEALYVSPNTVKTHVTSLLHKLRADTRVQLAAIATRHGLS